MDTLNNPFVQAHDPDLVDKVREIISGKKSMRTEEEESAYQKFFQKALKKFGVKTPSELTGKKKKEFFEYVDKNWKSADEQKVDGRTKVYKTTTSRLIDGKRRTKVNTSLDGRTRAYKETVKRIEARRTKNSEKSQED